jgi:hypothetical protein
MLPSTRAGASPRPAPDRSLPRPVHVERIHPAQKQCPFTSEVLNQIDLHRGTAPASNVHLRKGLDATLSCSLPSTEQSDLTRWGIPVPRSVTAVVSICSAGVTPEP